MSELLFIARGSSFDLTTRQNMGWLLGQSVRRACSQSDVSNTYGKLSATGTP